jgi:hypothetical protein
MNVNPRSHERPPLGASRSARCDSGDALNAHHRERLQCARPHPTSYGVGSCTLRRAYAAPPAPRGQSSQGRAVLVGRAPGTQTGRSFEALSCDVLSTSNANANRKRLDSPQERWRGQVNVSLEAEERARSTASAARTSVEHVRHSAQGPHRRINCEARATERAVAERGRRVRGAASWRHLYVRLGASIDPPKALWS